MKSKDNSLNEFYERLIDFLISNDLEKPENLSGYNKSEIKYFEQENKIVLPEAYKLFLTNFAKGNPLFFDHQDYKLESINYSRETAEQLLKKVLPIDIFVFTEWQGYNYDYFRLTSGSNPEVTFGIIASGDPNDDRVKEKSKGIFTDWICKKIEINIKLRERLEGLKVDRLMIELYQIKNIVNTI
jgi:hypothetical protein